MAHLTRFFCLFLMIVAFGRTAWSDQDLVSDKAASRVSSAGTDFAGALYREFAKTSGNQFFSPYSISSCLTMTAAGARGETETAMLKTMHHSLDNSQVHDGFKSLKDDLGARAQAAGIKLNIANGLCLVKGDVKAEFKDLISKSYDAEIFGGDVVTINNWVKDKTEGKIKTILGDLPADTFCVLLNAIYFKGNWEHQFNADATHDADFIVAKDKTVKIPMMRQSRDMSYYEDKSIQAISLPYSQGAMSMIVVLPREANGLAALESGLTGAKLESWADATTMATTTQVNLSLPKFEMKTTYSMNTTLKNLGMDVAFTAGKADFSGIGGIKGALYISQVIHKAYVNVNEEGTEAAAATAVRLSLTSAGPKPKSFIANHPFMFYIRDNATGTILFMGRCSDPS